IVPTRRSVNTSSRNSAAGSSLISVRGSGRVAMVPAPSLLMRKDTRCAAAVRRHRADPRVPLRSCGDGARVLKTKRDAHHVNNPGWTEIVRLLIAAGANVNIADRQGVLFNTVNSLPALCNAATNEEETAMIGDEREEGIATMAAAGG